MADMARMTTCAPERGVRASARPKTKRSGPERPESGTAERPASHSAAGKKSSRLMPGASSVRGACPRGRVRGFSPHSGREPVFPVLFFLLLPFFSAGVSGACRASAAARRSMTWREPHSTLWAALKALLAAHCPCGGRRGKAWASRVPPAGRMRSTLRPRDTASCPIVCTSSF
ncbi:hypothetical protein CNY67_14620 [Desulfovibrio sp. G11]|nr:hypothetical protein CNY67_14620 [Desulfovibrio sp. G11]